ncbi:MAG: hypothetical protein AAF409_10320 [Pseudomonadota bacterium]
MFAIDEPPLSEAPWLTNVVRKLTRMSALLATRPIHSWSALLINERDLNLIPQTGLEASGCWAYLVKPLANAVVTPKMRYVRRKHRRKEHRR